MLNQHINGEKMSVAPKVEFSSSNLKAAEASKEGSISETHDRQLDDNIDREKLMKSKKELKMAEKNARKSGAVEKESVVSVPWRLPRSKREENKQPGFNLDYSPPKTHPPSHN
ncbi:hypothetical protein JCGZ_14563 [Jatropha curcas]|uniref:Uncharacterized protein n=2 Tax=Jatropha curcas TaxID=180498 RepID=A0A067JY46_JATCU|nr:hypothetical protein JCGZ_14563 [Jatropha curcas]